MILQYLKPQAVAHNKQPKAESTAGAPASFPSEASYSTLKEEKWEIDVEIISLKEFVQTSN